MDRSGDWFRQAQRDLRHARHALEDQDFEWACFAAQQAAEKAVKALHQRVGMEGWGHSVKQLLASLPPQESVPAALHEAGLLLDRFYIPTRYPNGFATAGRASARQVGCKDCNRDDDNGPVTAGGKNARLCPSCSTALSRPGRMRTAGRRHDVC